MCRGVILSTTTLISRALGEESYTTFDATAFERVDETELPAVYLDHLAALSNPPTAATAAP